MNISRYLAVTLTALCIGLLTVWLLPAILFAWLDASWRRHELDALLDAARPHRCDGGEEGDIPIEHEAMLEEYPLPKVFEAWIRKQGLR